MKINSIPPSYIVFIGNDNALTSTYDCIMKKDDKSGLAGPLYIWWCMQNVERFERKEGMRKEGMERIEMREIWMIRIK